MRLSTPPYCRGLSGLKPPKVIREGDKTQPPSHINRVKVKTRGFPTASKVLSPAPARQNKRTFSPPGRSALSDSATLLLVYYQLFLFSLQRRLGYVTPRPRDQRVCEAVGQPGACPRAMTTAGRPLGSGLREGLRRERKASRRQSEGRGCTREGLPRRWSGKDRPRPWHGVDAGVDGA